MKRRTFLMATAATGALAVNANAQGDDPRECYELRTYTFDTNDQRDRFAQFIAAAAIPAMNRAGIERVGAFLENGDAPNLRVLIPHTTTASCFTLQNKLDADAEFQKEGGEILNAPASEPAYTRIETALFHAFTAMPKLEVPTRAPERVLQLRIYESPSVAAGQKKIEMFNTGEIAVFRKTGLHPVFFGQAVAGPQMPNLTYMLAFENEDELKANWNKFRVDPDWQRLKAIPEYADAKIISNITNILLKPTPGSQI